ncbi:TPA: hypothetical protein R1908_002110 [Staphylococcus delphini]|nr:hypothetical protein [Staphylococcus delphini]
MFGATIEIIRKNKNIPVTSLCENIFTRSAYYKYVNNRMDTSITNFFSLLDRLNITPEEFLIIHENGCSNKTMKVLETLDHFTIKKDVSSLKSMTKIISVQFSEPKRSHLLEVVDSRINKILNIENSIKCQNISRYLIDAEYWTKYELTIFSNCMYIFDIELIDILLSKCLKRFTKFEDLRPYGNDQVRIIVNALVIAIERNDRIHFNKWLSMAYNISVKENNFFELYMVKLFKLFETYLKSPSNNIENAIALHIKFCDSIGANNYKNMFESLFEKIQKIRW